MSTSYDAKDTLVRGAQLKAQSVSVRADLETGLTEEPSIATVTDPALATCSIAIDVKENVTKIHSARVYDRKTGSYAAQSAEATFSGSIVTIADVDANVPDLSSATIELVYEVE